MEPTRVGDGVGPALCYPRIVLDAAVAVGRKLSVGEFVFDPGTGEIWAPGDSTPSRLRPRSAKLLSHLAQRSGQLVSRREAQQLLWGDRCVDAEQGLNACIRDIRRQFGDSAAESAIIETLPGRGYRLIARVAPFANHTHAWRSGWRRAAPAAVSAVLLIFAISSSWIHRSSGPTASGNAEAEALVREADYLAKSGDPAALSRTVPLLEAAIELDPTFAPAYGKLAQVSFLTGDINRAHTFADRTLALDPELAEAHAAAGFLAFYDSMDFKRAESHLERAVQLDPSSATSRHAFAHYLSATGRHNRAIQQTLTALELDPVDARLRGDAGWVFYWARRFPEAVTHARRALTLDPDDRSAHACLFSSLVASARFEEASREILALAMRVHLPQEALAQLSAGPAEERIRAYWESVVNHPIVGSDPSRARLVAFAQLGQVGDARRELAELSVSERPADLLFLRLDPLLDPVQELFARRLFSTEG